MKFKQFVSRAKQLTKRNTPTILSVMASLGVIGVAYLAAKGKEKYLEEEKHIDILELEGKVIDAGGLNKAEYGDVELRDDSSIYPSIMIKEELFPKVAEKKDFSIDIFKQKAGLIVKSYWPAALLAGITIGCIVEANILNKKEQMALLTSYVGLQEYFKKYRKTLIEEQGPEADERIREKIEHDMQRNCCSYHCIDLNCPDRKVKWLEPITGQIFWRYEREIIDAEYHFNRNFVNDPYGHPFSSFLEMLGIEVPEESKRIGWSIEDMDFYWCDFEHIYDPDRDLYVIEPMYPPTEDAMRED